MINSIIDLTNTADNCFRNKTFIQAVRTLASLTSTSLLGIYILQHNGLSFFDHKILTFLPESFYLYAYSFVVLMFIINVAHVWKKHQIPN